MFDCRRVRVSFFVPQAQIFDDASGVGPHATPEFLNECHMVVCRILQLQEFLVKSQKTHMFCMFGSPGL